jgi:hypothetical protein
VNRLWRRIPGRRYLKRLLLTAVLCVIVAGGALAGFLVSRNFTVDDALALLGAALPVDASDVQFATKAEPVRIFWLRFSLDTADSAAAFWEQTGMLPPRDGFTPFPQPNPYETALAWWQPWVTTYSGSYTNTGATIIEALVDRSSAAGVVVYLRAYAL